MQCFPQKKKKSKEKQCSHSATNKSFDKKVPTKLGDRNIQAVKVMVHRFFHWDQYLSRNLVLSLDGLHY